jgi:hypothetical protein
MAGMAGDTFSAEFTIADTAVGLELQAMFGGHLDLSVSKTRESETSFGLDVSLSPEQDIARRDPDGNPVLGPDGRPVPADGKVDAYRFMTFYLAPRNDHHDLFFNRVVDPLWLNGNDPGAVALRQARQPGKQPACWRVLHRVTFVSRVLPAPTGQPTTLAEALPTLDISSNYGLVMRLGPYVARATGDYPTFAGAVGDAVARRLPQLQPHLAEVVAVLAQYYGVLPTPA